MVQIQVNLDKLENKLVAQYKLDHDLKTKADAIRIIIRCYLDPEVQDE